MKKKTREYLSGSMSACLSTFQRFKVWVSPILDRAIYRFNHRLTLAARNVLIFSSGIVLTIVIYKLV
jgi:hypothetical protein